MIAALAMRKPARKPRWALVAVSARRMVSTLTLEHSVVRSDLPVSLFDDLNNPRVSDLAGSASVKPVAAAFPPVHDCSVIPGHEGRDCQGRIISSPVTAAEAQPVVSLSSLDEMDAALRAEAWEAAFVAYPIHWRRMEGYYPTADYPDAGMYTPPCCAELMTGECSLKRAAFVTEYIAHAIDQIVSGAIAQLVATLPEVSSSDHDLDLRSDPVHALAEDHIRVAKPNRMRSRG